MLKSDMIYQINLRLQEIKENSRDFGNISVIIFGDPLQLKPVMGKYPWEEPRHPSYQEAHLIDPLWSHFQSVILRTNHRQGADKTFGDILNRIRVKEWTIEDIEELKKRVVPRDSSLIPSDSIHIYARNVDVNQRNEQCLEVIDGQEYSIDAYVQHPTMTNYIPKVDITGNITNTNLQKNFKFKIGAKVMLTYNIKTTDSLVNGAIGNVVGVKLNAINQPSEIHVNFSNLSIGAETSKNFPQLEEKYGVPVVPITRYEATFRIGRGNAGVKSTASALQFPLKLSFSVTSHKVS